MTERNPGAGEPGEDPESTLPAEEEAAWAQIVAAYGEEPDTDATLKDHDPGAPGAGADGAEERGDRDTVGPPVRSFTVYAAGTGPRDWRPPEDEGDDHFVPPEPPPLPETDTPTRFGWLALLGGPLLLLAAVLFRFDTSWWLLTLGLGGFLGGFATLVTRMRDGRDDDDFDDPGRGAVV